MKLLEDHVNNAHGQALAEENKKCSYCNAAFETVHELQEHIVKYIDTSLVKSVLQVLCQM